MVGQPPVREVKEVDRWELRCKFKLARYYERQQAGEFTIKYMRDKPAPATAGQPPDTRTQMISYLDRSTGEEVARVHQYLRPDGTLGASGKPDPLRLVYKGILYKQPEGRKPEVTPPTTAFGRVRAQATLKLLTIWGPIRCRLFER